MNKAIAFDDYNRIVTYMASIEGLLVLSSQALTPLLREDNTSSPSIVANSSKAR